METNINDINNKEPIAYQVQRQEGLISISPQELFDRIKEEENNKKLEIARLIDIRLRNGSRYEEIKDYLEYTSYGNIGVAIYKGEATSWYKYSENKGVEYYFGLQGLKKSEFFDFGLEESGHEYKNGKLYKDGELIPQFLENGEVNPKYIISLDKINFYRNIQVFYGALIRLRNGGDIKTSFDSLMVGIVSGVVRIKDLMEYKSHGYISDEEFPQLLIRAIQELPNQCSDMRFYKNASGTRLGAEVTKAEIDEYLNPTSGNPLITQEVYNDCLRRIEARDKKILQKREIETQTRGSLEVEKETLTTRERIIRILEGRD